MDAELEQKLKADILKVIDEADKNDGWVLRHVIENELLGYYSRAEIDRVLMKSFLSTNDPWWDILCKRG